MKYFTVDLLRRFQSSDDQIADAADDEWERMGEEYRAWFKSIRSQLPAGMRELHRKYYLHDASVFPLKASRKEFVMRLKLDTPPHEELLLRYHLAKKPRFVFHSSVAEKGCPYLIWLYHEIEQVKHSGQFSHSILFNNGIELTLLFTDLELTLLNSGNPDPSLWKRKLTQLLKQSA